MFNCFLIWFCLPLSPYLVWQKSHPIVFSSQPLVKQFLLTRERLNTKHCLHKVETGDFFLFLNFLNFFSFYWIFCLFTFQMLSSFPLSLWGHVLTKPPTPTNPTETGDSWHNHYHTMSDWKMLGWQWNQHLNNTRIFTQCTKILCIQKYDICLSDKLLICSE